MTDLNRQPAQSPLPTAPVSDPASAQTGSRHLLLRTVEGRILLVGLGLAVLLFLALGIAWFVAPDSAFVYIVMSGLNLTVGRAAGMSFGYASGMGHARVVPLNMLVETIQVIVVYPLFALTWMHLIDTPRWRAMMGRLHQAAESNRAAIQRYGILGLFLFVFTPLWMTGPVVGAIIGFLIGLRARVNLAVVLSATYVAIGIWALLLNELNEWAAAYDRLAPFALVLAIVLLALSGRLLKRLPHPHRHRP